jgi:hypothetical protein
MSTSPVRGCLGMRSTPASLPPLDQPDPVTGGTPPPQHELTHVRGPVEAVAG